MRDIKFRGWNCKNKRWIYGYYFVNRGEHFISPDEVVNPLVRYDDFVVDKDSVGQYTGLKDSNGKEIYEGDIVTIDLWTALVTWNEEFATFALQFDFENKVGRRSLGEWEDTIVIGNIHENPELLTNNE